jgi:hypothetical protein
MESYAVPALIVEDLGSKVLVRFAAGNLRIVPLDLIGEANPAEIDEYEESATLCF